MLWSLCIFSVLVSWPDDIITGVTDHAKVKRNEITLVTNTPGTVLITCINLTIHLDYIPTKKKHRINKLKLETWLNGMQQLNNNQKNTR